MDEASPILEQILSVLRNLPRPQVPENRTLYGSRFRIGEAKSFALVTQFDQILAADPGRDVIVFSSNSGDDYLIKPTELPTIGIFLTGGDILTIDWHKYGAMVQQSWYVSCVAPPGNITAIFSTSPHDLPL